MSERRYQTIFDPDMTRQTLENCASVLEFVQHAACSGQSLNRREASGLNIVMDGVLHALHQEDLRLSDNVTKLEARDE